MRRLDLSRLLVIAISTCMLLCAASAAAAAINRPQTGPVAGPASSIGPARPQAAAEAHYLQGDVYYSKGDWEDAITEYCKSFQLAPNSNASRLNLASAFEADGDWGGAAAIYREAVIRAPASTALRKSLAIAQINSGDLKSGIQELQKLAQLDPGDESVHRELGAALGKTGDWDSEAAEEKKAIQISPGDDKALLALSDALARKADWRGALAELRKAAELKPQNAGYAAKLGTFYEITGKKAEALREYQKAVMIAPKNTRYRSLYTGLAQILGSAVAPNGFSETPPKPARRRSKRMNALPLYTPAPPDTSNPAQPNLPESLGIRFRVEKDGSTSHVSIAGKGLGTAIDAAVLAIVGSWKFRPAMRKGVPIPSKASAAITDNTKKPFWSTIGNHGGGCAAHLPGGVALYSAAAFTRRSQGELPSAVYSPDPPYSAAARRAKRQAHVLLEILVKYDGTVAAARVVKPAGFGLDESALKTVLTWRFKPATMNGIPVNARLYVDISYTLRP